MNSPARLPDFPVRPVPIRWPSLVLLACLSSLGVSTGSRAAAFQSRLVDANGIRLHIIEEGQGPLIVLCHGFPETSYSWRHQIPLLARSGYHVVAPDQRGYGESDQPASVQEYNIFKLTGDIVGLVHALGEKQAILVGHDWGAAVASCCALLRPDIFTKLILLSVPYGPRGSGSVPPIEAARTAGLKIGREFYQVTFQDPKRCEERYDHDPRSFLKAALIGASGDAPPAARWNPWSDPKQSRAPLPVQLPDELPAWLTEADLDIYTRQFEKSGFRGAFNWYRNIDFNWSNTGFLAAARISQPALFIVGERDGVLEFTRGQYDQLEDNIPRLWKKVIIPAKGHWIQQEAPEEVSRLILEFLKN